MKRMRSRLTWLLVACLLGFVASCSSVPLRRDLSGPEDRISGEQAAFVISRACDLVSRKFYDEALLQTGGWRVPAVPSSPLPETTAGACYAQLNERLGSLKISHLAAMPSYEAREYREQARVRMGFSWRLIKGTWVVESVIPGGPADEAGIRAGWILDTADGVKLDPSRRLRFREGQSVVLKGVNQKDEPVSVTVHPRRLSTEGVLEDRELEGGVVYLRFDNFNGKSRRWLSAQLKRNATAPAVIIDLRWNSGGELISLDLVAGEFFEHKVSVGTLVFRDKDRDDEHSWLWSSAKYRGRVVVLTDESSFSAAEILAHTLHFYKRAVLVGRKTGGAVVVSREYGLPDGGLLQIPIADYVALDGSRLETAGVPPDVVVERTVEALRQGRDQDLEAALAFLRSTTLGQAK